MRQYKIYLKPNNEYEAVKIGWSWPAFLFAGCWALTKGLWLVALFISAIFVLLIAAVVSVFEAQANIELVFNIISLIWLSIKIVLGVKANELRDAKLLSNGSILKGSLFSQNDEYALFEYNQILASCAVSDTNNTTALAQLPKELSHGASLNQPLNQTFQPANSR